MGYWGCEPRDGDHPLDLFHRVEDAGAKALAKLFARKRLDLYDRWGRVGTLQETLYRGLTVPVSIVQQAVKDIDIVTDDDVFVESWKDPGRFLDEALRFKGLFDQLAKESLRPRRRSRRGMPKPRYAPRAYVPMGWPDLQIRRGRAVPAPC